MKTQMLHFIDTLSLYDYLLFGGILFFFFFFLILAVLLHRKLALAITLIVTAFILLVSAPLSYMALHTAIYKHAVTLTTVQDLAFTEALLIKGDINNTSKETFKECTLTFGISKVSSIGALNKVYPYLPFRRQTLVLSNSIKPHQGESFKLLIEPFKYSKKFSVTAWGQCR
ncbi:MAG: DUF2393 family protein [Sulfuricurvum sp.]|nr:DUF2393 family protein [Sulfuricurvum sp.]